MSNENTEYENFVRTIMEALLRARACVGCCQDHDYLCNTEQPHAFESCESTP